MAAIGTLLVAGCGSSDSSSSDLPAACLGEPRTFLSALERAPAPVRLAGGVPVSRCVRLAARRDGDLQQLGVTLTTVADELHFDARANPRAAVRLGYLIGAVRRGARQTPGSAAQLARRIEQTASLADTLARGALLRGVFDGEDTG